MSQTSTSRPDNPATDPSRVEGISCAQSAFCPSISSFPRVLHFRSAPVDKSHSSHWRLLFSVPPAEDEDPPSAAVEVGRRIDGLHEKLREVTGFLGNVQKSLDTVFSVLEEVEHNVKALSNQTAGTPLVRLPVMPELPTTPQLAGKSLRDEDDSLEAGPNEERKKKRRTDDIPKLRDITAGGAAANKTAEGEQEPTEPTEETICSGGTDC